MDPNSDAYIRESVSNHLSYRWEGRVPLREILRLFSEYGSPGELQKCMDKLTHVEPPIAKEVLSNDEVFYVFPSVAKEIARRSSSEIQHLKNQEKTLQVQINDLKDKLSLMARLRYSWLAPWKNLEVKDQLRMEELILSFWQRFFIEHQRILSEASDQLQEVNEKITSLKSRLDSSYEAV